MPDDQIDVILLESQMFSLLLHVQMQIQTRNGQIDAISRLTDVLSVCSDLMVNLLAFSQGVKIVNQTYVQPIAEQLCRMKQSFS